ncbi:hypothetical protein Nepgr_021681 [Nepenthes gracilis]|uniref:Uncharacterized protein n=1 Tax=Nepenthes gracilis TaxID=150966 RepID=A0AAD3SZ75_NEPGR|nr:hypothetical protein Nepgr_021681 [Nepenthes gracilis]
MKTEDRYPVGGGPHAIQRQQEHDLFHHSKNSHYRCKAVDHQKRDERKSIIEGASSNENARSPQPYPAMRNPSVERQGPRPQAAHKGTHNTPNESVQCSPTTPHKTAATLANQPAARQSVTVGRTLNHESWQRNNPGMQQLKNGKQLVVQRVKQHLGQFTCKVHPDPATSLDFKLHQDQQNIIRRQPRNCQRTKIAQQPFHNQRHYRKLKAFQHLQLPMHRITTQQGTSQRVYHQSIKTKLQKNDQHHAAKTQHHYCQQNYSSGLSFLWVLTDQLPSSWIQDIKHANQYISLVSAGTGKQKSSKRLFLHSSSISKEKNKATKNCNTGTQQSKADRQRNQERRPSLLAGIPCLAIESTNTIQQSRIAAALHNRGATWPSANPSSEGASSNQNARSPQPYPKPLRNPSTGETRATTSAATAAPTTHPTELVQQLTNHVPQHWQQHWLTNQQLGSVTGAELSTTETGQQTSSIIFAYLT